MSKIKLISIFLLLSFIFWFFDVSPAFAHGPHDEIIALEISPNYDRDRTVLAVVRESLLKSTNGGDTWKRVVNGLDNRHQFSSLTSSDFSDRNTFFVSSTGDGIYKSEDGGDSWLKVNNGLDNLKIDTVYVSASQVAFATGSEQGLYKTKNNGDSWYKVFDGQEKVTAIASSVEQKGLVLIGDEQGTIYLSEDGGDNWKKLFQFSDSGSISAIAVSSNFSVDRTFFVGTSSAGVFKTVDNGRSFSEINNGISDKSIVSLVVLSNSQAVSTLFVSTWNEGVFRSTDGGNTWKKTSKGLTTDAQADQFNVPHFTELSFSKTLEKDQTVFLAGFDGLFKSTDGGYSWRQLDTLLPSLIMALEVSPGYQDDSTVMISTYHWGTYLSNDGGKTWRPNRKGMVNFFSTVKRFLKLTIKDNQDNRRIIRLNNIAFSPNYPADNTMLATERDHYFKSTDGGTSWNKIEIDALKDYGEAIVPDQIAISPNFASDNTLFFGARGRKAHTGNIGIILKSTNEGSNFSIVLEGVGGYIQSLVISPNYSADQTVYVSAAGDKEGVYKSTDGGQTWRSVNSGLGFIDRDVELSISPNYEADKTLLAGTQYGLFKTTNGGVNWEKLAGSAYGGDGYIEAIAISPNYKSDQTFVVSVRGRGLFKTVDGGTSFSEMGEELIENNHFFSNMWSFSPAQVIKFSPSYVIDNTIYGTSATELFKSTDGGNTWETLTIEYEGMGIKFVENFADYYIVILIALLSLMFYFPIRKLVKLIQVKYVHS